MTIVQSLNTDLKGSQLEVTVLNAQLTQIKDTDAENEVSMEVVFVFMKSVLRKMEEMEKENGLLEKREMELIDIKSEKDFLNVGLISELGVNLEEISMFNAEIGESKLKEKDSDKKLDEFKMKVDKKIEGI